MAHAFTKDSHVWPGGGAGRGSARDGLFRLVLALFIPPRGQKVVPTKAGITLFVVAIAVGMAAYNTASNILFITLSLLLATIIVSGLLSWLNFRRTEWRISLEPPFRAGDTAVVGLEVYNGKRHLPTYSLGFEFRTSSGERGRLVLRERLEPGCVRRMEWTFRPMRRGRELVEMTGVGSQYPFGFLHKYFGGRIAQEVHVWPARVPYEADLAALATPDSVGEVLNRTGAGNDFVNLRHYRPGDPVRHVHWKATARQRRLVVREVLAENHSGFFLHIETPAVLWRRTEQFEKLCSFAAGLAEDLFRQQQLIGVVINDRAPIRIRRMADLVLFLDQLAILQPVEHYLASGSIPSRNVIRFEPAAPDGVHAFVRGQKAAAA